MIDIKNEIDSSDGKQYDCERAIISLTSWKARINTVGLTIFSLLRHCSEFHIVLVLSLDEFPHKMNDMPNDLLLLIKNKMLEIIWVKTNYKSFKKVIFTMYKYNRTPIISADDDCIYICNYAAELLNAYNATQSIPINYRKSSFKYCTCGPATIYPPRLYNYIIEKFSSLEAPGVQDDGFFSNIFRDINVQPLHISNKFPCYFHDETNPITGSINVPEWRRDQQFH